MNGIGIRRSIVRTTIEVCLNEKMDGSKWLVHGKGVLDEGENESGSMKERKKEREKVSLKHSCV